MMTKRKDSAEKAIRDIRRKEIRFFGLAQEDVWVCAKAGV